MDTTDTMTRNTVNGLDLDALSRVVADIQEGDNQDGHVVPRPTLQSHRQQGGRRLGGLLDPPEDLGEFAVVNLGHQPV